MKQESLTAADKRIAAIFIYENIRRKKKGSNEIAVKQKCYFDTNVDLDVTKPLNEQLEYACKVAQVHLAAMTAGTYVTYYQETDIPIKANGALIPKIPALVYYNITIDNAFYSLETLLQQADMVNAVKINMKEFKNKSSLEIGKMIVKQYNEARDLAGNKIGRELQH